MRAPSTRRPRRWYRRKRVIVPLAMLAILLLALAAGWWYIASRFDALDELSTPPPQVSGDRLGGEEDLVIDTGPAQDAIREAEARREAAPEAGEPAATAPLLAALEATEASRTNLTGAGGTETPASTTAAAPRATVTSGSGPPEPSEGTDAPVPAAPPVLARAAGGTPVVGSPVPVTTGDATPTVMARVPEPVAAESYAVLAMGVDARPGEAIDVGVRPDSLFVVYLDGTDGSCRVLSIPRDTRVELPGYGQSKINHALAVGGVPYERLVVENLLGIELEHYGLIDFAGVEGLVDSVGGITVVNDEPFVIDGHQFPEGTLELDGEEALTYSRYRGGPDGDFGRQERQQDVVRAILTQGADMDAVTAIPSLLRSVSDHVRTDVGLEAMVDIVQDYRSTCTGGTLQTGRIEGTVGPAYDELMQQELSFVFVAQDEIDRKVRWLLTGEEPGAGG